MAADFPVVGLAVVGAVRFNRRSFTTELQRPREKPRLAPPPCRFHRYYFSTIDLPTRVRMIS